MVIIFNIDQLSKLIKEIERNEGMIELCIFDQSQLLEAYELKKVQKSIMLKCSINNGLEGSEDCVNVCTNNCSFIIIRSNFFMKRRL